MPRPPGSRNKKTIEREAAAKAALTPALLPSAPFEDGNPRAEESITSTITSMSPPSQAGQHCEYPAPNGDKWRVEDGQRLLKDFGLDLSELPKWHEALAPNKNVWHLLRRHYAIAPLIGESNVEYLRPASLEEIGVPLSMDAAQLGEQIESAKQFWIRWRMSHKSNVEKPAVIAPPVPEDKAAALLKRYGFSDLSDKDQRAYAAQRLVDFEHKLSDEEGGSIPPQAIRLELQLANIDTILDELAKEVRTNEVKRKDYDSWLSTRNKTATQYLEIMKALNATQEQNPSAQRKLANIDCLGTLVKAVQEYEARGDTELLDGIHAAGEFQFLVTPTSLRPAQYRPDAVQMLNDALKHENFWNPEYVPPSLPRQIHRRLLKGFREGVLSATAADGKIIEMDDDESAAPSHEYDNGEPSSTAMPMTTGRDVVAVQQPVSRIKRTAGNEFVAG